MIEEHWHCKKCGIALDRKNEYHTCLEDSADNTSNPEFPDLGAVIIYLRSIPKKEDTSISEHYVTETYNFLKRELSIQ